jgi:predicted Na+-dependent transporter
MVMPLVAIMLARFFELPAGIAIGMVLVSALSHQLVDLLSF